MRARPSLSAKTWDSGVADVYKRQGRYPCQTGIALDPLEQFHWRVCKSMRNTTSPFLRVLKLVTACALLATVPLGLGTVSSAGLNNYVSASSEYVALGDSYASGEGLQSNATTYISPSNNDGCHRSVTAYPVLVAASLNVDLGQFEAYGSGGFVACSGATSKDLLKGENGEPAQLSALSSATRWVTVTAEMCIRDSGMRAATWGWMAPSARSDSTDVRSEAKRWRDRLGRMIFPSQKL